MTTDNFLKWEEIVARIENASYEYAHLKEYVDEELDLKTALDLIDKIHEKGIKILQEHEKNIQ